MKYQLLESEARRFVSRFTLSEIEWLTSHYEGRTEGRTLTDLYRELAHYGMIDSATRKTVHHRYFSADLGSQ